MEVRIKDNNGYVDADWTIEDGIMVVSPKVEKFEPKDGDVVTTEGGRQVFINKKYIEKGCGYAYIGWNFNDDTEFIEDQWCYSRFATEEEKNKLFDKLNEKGYEWDAEKKEIVKIKWKPVLGEVYYRPQLYQGYFEICKEVWNDSTNDEIFYNKCWCFKTGTKCQAFCNELNQAIEGIKP